MKTEQEHITVCICTYKRAKMLEHLLNELQKQRTDQLFTYTIVVVDNDHAESAKDVVVSVMKKSSVHIEYYVEPEQNIALARNKAIQNANGDYIALIDDDEYPEATWLLFLYTALNQLKVDGVLGPVKPVFEQEPPRWVVRGKFYEKPSHKTGFILKWKNTRTSNVLLKKSVFDGNKNLFDPKFGRGGEDRDFFRRMIVKGYVFVWCDEAPVYEIISPERCKRIVMLKRALIRGQYSLHHPSSLGKIGIFKSMMAVPLYTLALPFLIILGHHIFMQYFIKDCDHIGKLLAFLGFDVVKERYV